MSMNRTMWFGPRGFETWIKMPRIDMESQHAHVGQRVDQIRGGVSINTSRAGHQEYGMSWNAFTRDDAALIQDIADGLYDTSGGKGLIHFIDPAAMDKNVLPKLWASPALCAYGAPSLTKGVKPTVSATASNALRLPAETATFTVGASNLLELYIPIPPGHTAHWAFYGPTTQANKIQYRTLNKLTASSPATVGIVAEASYGTGLTSTAASGSVTGILLNLTPSGGAVNLTAGLMVIRPTAAGTPAAPTRYVSGRGNSGCSLDPQSLQSVIHNVYRDRTSVALRLIERGSWL